MSLYMWALAPEVRPNRGGAKLARQTTEPLLVIKLTPHDPDDGGWGRWPNRTVSYGSTQFDYAKLGRFLGDIEEAWETLPERAGVGARQFSIEIDEGILIYNWYHYAIRHIDSGIAYLESGLEDFQRLAVRELMGDILGLPLHHDCRSTVSSSHHGGIH